MIGLDLNRLHRRRFAPCFLAVFFRFKQQARLLCQRLTCTCLFQVPLFWNWLFLSIMTTPSSFYLSLYSNVRIKMRSRYVPCQFCGPNLKIFAKHQALLYVPPQFSVSSSLRSISSSQTSPRWFGRWVWKPSAAFWRNARWWETCAPMCGCLALWGRLTSVQTAHALAVGCCSSFVSSKEPWEGAIWCKNLSAQPHFTPSSSLLMRNFSSRCSCQNCSLYHCLLFRASSAQSLA